VTSWRDFRGGRAGTGYGRLSPVRPGVRPGGMRPGGLRPGGIRPGGMRPGGMRPGRLRHGDLGPGGLRSGGLTRPKTLWQRAMDRQSMVRRFDWLLTAAVLGLSLIGTLLVWSATEHGLAQAGADPQTYLKKQLLNIVIGLALMVTVSTFDYRTLRIYAPIAYAVTCLGLLVVLSPIGSTVNGAHSWIALPGGFQVEPSEFAKITLILMTAMILSELRDGDRRPRLRDLAVTLACGLLPLGLVVAEPDLGVSILMVTLLAGIIALSGVRLRWLAGLGAVAALAGLVTWSLHLLKPYQVQRLTAFVNPSADPRGTGYSAAQAKIAIGSGGMFGHGLFHGPLVAGNFVPEQHTDFIFAVAGEELGFVGTIAIVGLIAVVLIRSLRIAVRADDQFGLLVASGIAIWFAVQAFINIGMTIGITPVTGLPLPFVSYGGSAMFADMIAIGVLQAIHRRRSVFD
jgi:rod shape determining protein RodA